MSILGIRGHSLSLMTLILFAAVFSGPRVHAADEIVPLAVEVENDKKGNLTQKEIFDRAIEKASFQQIEQMIGESRTNKNQTLIKNRILKNSGKYISFIKVDAQENNKDTGRYSVAIKFSPKNLEALLLQEGLLYKTDGPPRLLPLISFIDRVNTQAVVWWTGQAGKGFLADESSRFHQSLRKELRSKGFFVLDPLAANYQNLLPTAFQGENPSTEDALLMADFFHSQILARGQVIISSQRNRNDLFRIEVRVSAVHATNGRVIGEVVRNYDTEAGAFHQVVKAKLEEVADKLAADLSGQILESWKSGTFGATLLSLKIFGDLSYPQMAILKKALLEQVKDFKTLKERLFEPGKVSFEADSSATAEQLAQAIKSKSFPKFKLTVTSVRPDGVDLRVQAL